MTPTVQTVEIGGRVAAFREKGDGDSILYLHGFPTSGYLWRHVMEVTSERYRAVACDFPGFGDSEVMERPHTWENLIDWLDSFVDAAGLAPVHLGVHDWGGLIGLAWACRHPMKVSSLLITNTSFRAKDRWHALAQQWREPGVGEEMIGDITFDGFSNLVGVISSVPEDALQEYWKGMATPERRAAKLQMYRSLDFEMLAPLEPLLPDVASGRVLVVWGGGDPFLSTKLGFRFGARLGCDVTVIDDAGHFLQEDRGEHLGRLHLEFLAGLPRLTGITG